jgi:hypothetical protein
MLSQLQSNPLQSGVMGISGPNWPNSQNLPTAHKLRLQNLQLECERLKQRQHEIRQVNVNNAINFTKIYFIHTLQKQI